MRAGVPSSARLDREEYGREREELPGTGGYGEHRPGFRAVFETGTDVHDAGGGSLVDAT